MEHEIKDLMNDYILTKAAENFDVKLLDLSLIGGFQNFVYEYVYKDKPYILRITHSSHRNQNSIIGELEWVTYLSNKGVTVSKPIYSIFNNLTEVIEFDNSYFIVASFEKAEGNKIFYPECMNNDLLSEMCGEITGKIHAHSINYLPSSNEKKRHNWKENYYLMNIKRFIPANQSSVFEMYELLKEQIMGLKIGKDYGIIHGDINVGNFLVVDRKITLFDFDECQYSWFVEDIAIQLFYMVYVILDDSIEERSIQALRFIKYFLNGYERHFSIDNESFMYITLFLKLRELIVYIGMYRSFDFSNLDDWTATYIEESRRRLERGIPIVENLDRLLKEGANIF